MLHELLLSLVGKTGQVIIPGNQCFQIDPSIDFLSDAEKELLNKICILGYHYSQIEKFLQQSSQSAFDIEYQYMPHDISEKKSIYNKAFCYGLEGLMEEYRERILDLERIFLKERRVFTFGSLSVKLSDYFIMFHEINLLIEEISSNQLRGGQIVDLLQVRSLSGHTVLQEMYKKILKYQHKVLFHQIYVWITNGALSDDSNEFFIISQENEERLDDWDSGFSLRLSMLPQTIISIQLAESILFIGKAQKVLNANNKALRKIPSQSFKVFQGFSSNDLTDTLLFQNTIENLRFEISQKLMELILKEGDLMNHLKNLKDFYFLEKGEFYQVFIEEIKNIIKLPPTSTVEDEINGIAYQNTALRLSWDNSQLLKDVKFKIPNNHENVWKNLTVDYNLKWPLNLFLSRQTMEIYSRIFRFLFPIRIIQTELHQVWLHLIKRKSSQTDSFNSKLLNLRNKIALFVDNLWSYFLFDVFEAEWKRLEETISQAKDFDEMRKVHNRYLNLIMSQTFLSSSTITKQINLIVDCCQRYVDLVQKSDILVINDEFKTNCIKINEDYEHTVAEMIQTLQILNTNLSLPFISQLLLKLDFNNQYTS